MLLRKALLTVSLVALCPWLVTVRAAEPAAIPPDQFDKLHKMIKPQPGEMLFEQIPWYLSVYEARKKAAEEGKPILVWSGSGGAPIGGC
jgi:hypothetical protein